MRKKQEQTKKKNDTRLCVFPGFVSRDQETDGQARPSGPSPAAVVSGEDLFEK